MKSNIPKIPLFLSAIIFCALLAAFLYFYREINNNNQESLVRETEWQRESERREEIRALDNSIKVIETERAELETHFAKSSDVVPLLDKVESLAKDAGTTAEVVSVDLTAAFSGLIVGMKASGNFAGLYQFLTLLENSPYELEFVSMDIQKLAGSDTASAKESKWDAIFKIKLLTFVE